MCFLWTHWKIFFKAMERWVEYAEKPCQSSHMLLDGLHAYVTYTVQIQIRLLGSQYWSDETKVQATTPEDSRWLLVFPSFVTKSQNVVHWLWQVYLCISNNNFIKNYKKVKRYFFYSEPSQSPELTPGGYVTWDCRQQKCLSLYWKVCVTDSRTKTHE